jgi:hypothetical protein
MTRHQHDRMMMQQAVAAAPLSESGLLKKMALLIL